VVEVEVARGKTVAESVKKIGVTEQTYCRWKKKFGGLRVDQAKRLKELEKENSRLKRLLADAELDKAILREVAEGKFWARQSDEKRSITSVTCSAGNASANVGLVASSGRRGVHSVGSDAFVAMSLFW
jgi:putative transposase